MVSSLLIHFHHQYNTLLPHLLVKNMLKLYCCCFILIPGNSYTEGAGETTLIYRNRAFSVSDSDLLLYHPSPRLVC